MNGTESSKTNVSITEKMSKKQYFTERCEDGKKSTFLAYYQAIY